jgi:UDP-glucose 4-epimerase
MFAVDVKSGVEPADGMQSMNILVAGGAGFVGSHVVDRLLRTTDATVRVFDNFSSGREWRLEPHLASPRLAILRGDLKDLAALTEATKGVQCVYHFASNPDIAKAMVDPSIDFWEGTYLTQNLLEAIRIAECNSLVYASGSGVYGDTGECSVSEDYAPMLPISPYGASKLACEAMIHAYVHMFGLQARVFRFANVVGPRQSHGVAFDFIRRLREDHATLRILGDGTQSKSYIHVDDIVAGIQYFAERDREPYSYYHLATDDYLTVREIADLVVNEMALPEVKYHYSGGSRGWKGDVPVVRFDLAKVRGAGWRAGRSSVEAMRAAIQSMLGQTALD